MFDRTNEITSLTLYPQMIGVFQFPLHSDWFRIEIIIFVKLFIII